jgi:hypothetical protein
MSVSCFKTHDFNRGLCVISKSNWYYLFTTRLATGGASETARSYSSRRSPGRKAGTTYLAPRSRHISPCIDHIIPPQRKPATAKVPVIMIAAIAVNGSIVRAPGSIFAIAPLIVFTTTR